MLQQGWTAIVLGMGLNPQQVRLIIRVAWVAFVSGHIAWVCGFLLPFGIASPFARAGDVHDIQKTMRVTARVSLQQELRAQGAAWCQLIDGAARDAVLLRIENLRIELRQIEPNAEIPPIVCRST